MAQTEHKKDARIDEKKALAAIERLTTVQREALAAILKIKIEKSGEWDSVLDTLSEEDCMALLVTLWIIFGV